MSGNCPVKKESLINKQIGSDTIDLNNFISLIGMLKGPDALLEFKESIMSSISSFVIGYRNNEVIGGQKGKWYIFIYSISNINKKVIESIGYLFSDLFISFTPFL